MPYPRRGGGTERRRLERRRRERRATAEVAAAIAGPAPENEEIFSAQRMYYEGHVTENVPPPISPQTKAVLVKNFCEDASSYIGVGCCCACCGEQVQQSKCEKVRQDQLEGFKERADSQVI